MEQQLTDRFTAQYHQKPVASYFAPGRVNLIGEHIDYNGGLVMPCAITAGTWLLMAPNNDGVIRFSSVNFEENESFSIQHSYQKTGHEWYNYPLGVFHELQKFDWLAGGLDLLYFGNIPIGSGLSSSASIEVLTAFALNDYFNLGHDKLELVKANPQGINEQILVLRLIFIEGIGPMKGTDKLFSYKTHKTNSKDYKQVTIQYGNAETITVDVEFLG